MAAKKVKKAMKKLTRKDLDKVIGGRAALVGGGGGGEKCEDVGDACDPTRTNPCGTSCTCTPDSGYAPTHGRCSQPAS